MVAVPRQRNNFSDFGGINVLTTPIKSELTSKIIIDVLSSCDSSEVVNFLVLNPKFYLLKDTARHKLPKEIQSNRGL